MFSIQIIMARLICHITSTKHMYKYKYIGNDMSNDKFRGWCAYICYIQCDIRCMCKKEIHTTIHNIINIIMKTEKC